MPIQFIRGVLKDPKNTGAVAPSSPFLAKEILSHWPSSPKATIVEYGPGTGAITKQLAKKLGAEQSFLGLEMNPMFIKHLNKILPDLPMANSSAEDIAIETEKRGLSKADLIVSGLPWANFNPSLQESILAATAENLAEGGVFSTFAYVHALPLPRARQFAGRLRKAFKEVNVSQVIWRNLPPAVIYHCSQEKLEK
jgi:phosphatidylethanolamine/phosphatidyl-N-methylethanolamine N-methyltransferase